MQKVLVVDDVEDNVTLLTFELEDDNFEVIPAYNGYDCLEIAESQKPAVILLDIRMPGIDGLETLQRLKNSPKTQDIPVIMVSANDEGANIIQAIDIGAHDFVPKPVEYPVLAARLRSALRLSKAQEALERMNIELQKLASQDPLTECYNRREFFNLTSNEISKALRYGRNVAFLMLDIDFFKSINDDYGHAVGDKALKKIANICKNVCRESDIFGRIGGEEFAICCPDTDIQGAQVISERVREACANEPLEYEDKTFTVTVSIGVSLLKQGDTIEKAMKRADELLYEAKKQGRNRCIVEEKQ